MYTHGKNIQSTQEDLDFAFETGSKPSQPSI